MSDVPPADSYRLRNRGPWVTLEYPVWPGFDVGQTTAAAAATGADFAPARRRDLFFSRFSIRSYHEAQQVHGADLRAVGGRSAGHLGVDGLLATRGGTLLSMRTADCLPVFLKNPSGTRYALLHAGWRGLRGGIVRRALERWFPEAVCAIVGVGIGQAAYPVGEEVLEALADASNLSRSEMRRRRLVDAGGHVDLAGLAERQLRISPVRVEAFTRLPIDTNESPVPLFSHRRNGTDCRMVNWIFRRET